MNISEREKELNQITLKFLDAFNRNDIDAVMSFFTEDATYNELHGKKNVGKENICKSFENLFCGKFGTVRFEEDDTFISVSENKVMSSWTLNLELEDAPKIMRGLDLLHFDGSLISFKGTYVKAVEALYQDK